MANIGVLGAGTWGMALACLLNKNGHNVKVWSALPEEIDVILSTHKIRNLDDVIVPETVHFTKQLSEVCYQQDMLVFAVPSVFMRSTAKAAAMFIREKTMIVNVSKGIENDTLYTMTQVIEEELNKNRNLHVSVVALSGPSHAEEVAREVPTAIVSASSDLSAAEYVQKIFMNRYFRVYTNPDTIGVELCGAVKNIIALASGISSGLGYGDNTRAALITRGMAEITRLGEKMGCFSQTFSGLAGMGDLVVTATSKHSRNNSCGELIGRGVEPMEAVQKIGMVVEGINALPATIKLVERYRVSMPIVETVDAIINNGKKPQEAVFELMTRNSRSEIGLDGNFEQILLQSRRKSEMKRVITYGTYDLLHYGHINLLRRAKALGDYLIVVLSSDEFNWEQKHKKTYFTYEQRKQLLESIRYVDLVIPENNWEQKRSDMHEYHIDTFVMGDDWKGKFDFLKEEGVDVVYLPRTPEISSSQMKRDLHDTDEVTEESKTSHDDLNTDPKN